MKRILLSFAILLVPVLALAQDNKKEIVKTGWNIGLLPAFRYDNDLGFQFGALSQLYHYGDGSDYPNYRHKVMAVASVYSRGAKQFSLDYDCSLLRHNERCGSILANHLPKRDYEIRRIFHCFSACHVVLLHL